jgi:hypothetical protein
VDNAEARAVASARLNELRAESYEELSRRLLGRQETDEVLGASGTHYQLEALAFKDGNDLRVIVLVDDGGLRAFLPLSEGFILTPHGTFVGE